MNLTSRVKWLDLFISTSHHISLYECWVWLSLPSHFIPFGVCSFQILRPKGQNQNLRKVHFTFGKVKTAFYLGKVITAFSVLRPLGVLTRAMHTVQNCGRRSIISYFRSREWHFWNRATCKEMAGNSVRDPLIWWTLTRELVGVHGERLVRRKDCGAKLAKLCDHFSLGISRGQETQR